MQAVKLPSLLDNGGARPFNQGLAERLLAVAEYGATNLSSR